MEEGWRKEERRRRGREKGGRKEEGEWKGGRIEKWRDIGFGEKSMALYLQLRNKLLSDLSPSTQVSHS